MTRAADVVGLVAAAVVSLGVAAGCGGSGAGASDALAPAPSDLAASADDGGPLDAGTDDAGEDGGGALACAWSGAPGSCLSLAACQALAGHSSEPGSCPGPSTIECCIVTPNVADNPPVPTGWKLMTQAQVTADMTTWAVAILHDPVTYPMFATTTRTFGTLSVLARVEWHPPDFQNSVIHRGVTLYVPA